MNAAVIDASALAAVAFAEAEGVEIARRLQQQQLHAPDLLFLELASVAWKKCRRASDARLRALITDQFEATLQQALTLHPVPSAAVLQLGLKTGLTVYDAAYCWLAQDLRLPLVTLDRRLQAAMESVSP